MKTTILLLLTSALALNAQAGSATWNLNPATRDWNTATNWTPNTVPHGPADTATFGVSNTTNVSLSASAEVNSIVFSPGASAFTIAPQPRSTLTISGTGIVNNSGSTQNLLAPKGPNGLPGTIEFAGASSAGDQVVVTNQGYALSLFTGTATAGNATLINQGGSVSNGFGGIFQFFDSSSAGNGIFINSDDGVDGSLGGSVIFFDTSTAANGTFTDESRKGYIFFFGSSTAGTATFLCKGALLSGLASTRVQFSDNSSADHATFTLEGGEASGAPGVLAIFVNDATGDESTFILTGGAVDGALGAALHFGISDLDHATAGNATLIANGGSNGGEGSMIVFHDSFSPTQSGGTSRIEVFGNGSLDVSLRVTHSLTIGSLEGDGRVFLGSAKLSTGKRMSTTFSGIIQDGGIVNGTGGSLSKLGSGTFQLSGANTYTGGTTVREGTLIVRNMSGSGTGTGTVNVNAGTLAGSGIISGAVTVGSGSGTGAFLAPATETTKPTTLTIQSGLTLNSDATYTYTFKAKKNKARTDLVIAGGVIINGATVNLSGTTLGSLRTGLTLTVLSNTSANPISGTFSNLPEGGIVTVNGNNLQASYSGGDGNDLTLTVVP